MMDDWPEFTEEDSQGLPNLPGYQFQRIICQHGPAILFQAIQFSTGRLVGIYCLKVNDPGSKSAFEKEVNIRTWLNHPNLVQLYDRINYQGRTYLIEERVHGGTLQNPFRFVGPQPILPTVALLEEVTRTVEYLHQNGIIHHDLNPDNIWLVPISFKDPDGNPKQSADHCYFGIPKINRFDKAVILEEEKEMEMEMEHCQPIRGGLVYMAPELLNGKSQATPSTDIYALGVIFYELLTGAKLFQFPRLEELLEKKLKSKYILPRKLRPDLDPELEKICLKCLEPNAENRFTTALALAESLANWKYLQKVGSNPKKSRRCFFF